MIELYVGCLLAIESISTGVDPRSLTLQNSDEFYLFMDMRAEMKWLSYQMTSKRWVLATEEYNRRLMKKKGQSIVQKNPQALLCALGDIEPKLMSKITKNDYACEPVHLPISPATFLTSGEQQNETASHFGVVIVLLCRT